MGDPLEDEEMDFMVADASYREGMHQMNENNKLKYLKSSWTDTLLTESEDGCSKQGPGRVACRHGLSTV
jgi:hypothetical protein